jgi:hypothetical protein
MSNDRDGYDDGPGYGSSYNPAGRTDLPNPILSAFEIMRIAAQPDMVIASWSHPWSNVFWWSAMLGPGRFMR